MKKFSERVKKVAFDPTGKKVVFTILELDASGSIFNYIHSY